ncbi:MAG: hypothetical protein RL235_525 [Chlamydiota bacterium]|jgi:uncharacterized UPF0160 family protein
MKKVPRSLGVHDGSFHADEVTACALLLLYDLIDENKVIRTRDPEKLSTCDFVCDVGGVFDPEQRRFDHHQVDYKGSLSSAGMVLAYLVKHKKMSEPLYTMLNETLIMGVDAHDNGVFHIVLGTTNFSQVISNFLPVRYDSPPEAMDAAFMTAVRFARGHLERLHERFAYTQECLEQVRQAMQNPEPILIFDESIPWIDNFFELGGATHPAQYVIMPSGDHWKLRGVPPTHAERMKIRRPLPLAWAGLHEAELQAKTQIKGAIFCHKGRFISIWKTKEDALKAAHLALKEGR